MKSLKLLAIILMFSIPVLAKGPISPEDETAIFFKDAQFVGVNKINNSLVNSNENEYIELVKKGRMGGWQRDFNVASLDANDQTAMAKVEITDSKLKQTEYLTLVKVDGAWKIVNRTYTVEMK